MRLIIQDGTGQGENLCNSCQHFAKAELQNGKTLTKCAYFDRPLNTYVRTCTGHSQKHETSLWEMKQQAWILEVKKGKKIGFVSPDKRSKEQDLEADFLI